MVAHSFQRRPVGLREDCLHLRRIEIAGRWDRRSLDRDVGRLLAGHEVEEAADRSKPTVASADRALPFVLGVSEERADLAGREVGERDVYDLAALSLRDE